MKCIKITAWFIVVAVLISISLYFSYKKARIAADEIVQPVMDELYHYNTSFVPIGFDGQINGPSWWISYEPKAQMVVAPLSVQVSIFGKVVMTTPKNLRKWILNYSTEKAQTEQRGLMRVPGRSL